MTFATAVPISFTSFVYRTNVYWSVIPGIKRKPHLSVVWNWYHFVAIAILHQPRPTDSVDINTRLQLSDTSSIPPMHGGFLLLPGSSIPTTDIGHRLANRYLVTFVLLTEVYAPFGKWFWMLWWALHFSCTKVCSAKQCFTDNFHTWLSFQP